MSEKPVLEARKVPKQLRSRRKVERLLAAAARVLSREGWAKLTTNRVAEEAGLSVGTLYQYFPNKQALVAELIDRHVSEELTCLSEELTLLQNKPLAMIVERLVTTYVGIHQADPELTRALHAQVPHLELTEPLRVATRRFEVQLSGVLRRHPQAAGGSDLAAFIAVNTVEALTLLALMEQPEKLREDAFLQEVVTLVSGYLLKERL